MFFSLYQSQNISDLNQSPGKLLPQSKSRSFDMKEASSPQKDKGQTEEVNWIRKKHNDFQQFNKLTPINISLSYNYNKKRRSNMFIKNQIITNRLLVQQNPEKKQPRFHSESVYLQQKKRKSQYSKFFNQTQIDTEHNFIGKSYLRQVQNCKINPQSLQSVSVSPQKTLLPKRSLNFSNQTSFTPFSNGSTSKVFECKQRSESLVYFNNKKSPNLKFLTQKSLEDEIMPKSNIKNALVTKILIKQIQDKVKNEIKSQMKTLKSLKMRKMKLKNIESNHNKSRKKSLHIEKSEKNLQKKSKHESNMSSKKNLMTKYSDSEIKFRQRFKNCAQMRRLQTSAESYEQQCYKILNEHSIEAIPEDLRPWESENIDFFEFR